MTLSLNAARCLHEGPHVVPFTSWEIALILETPEYADEVTNILTGGFALGEDDEVTYGHRTYLDRAQLSLLLSIITRNLPYEYVLGVLSDDDSSVDLEREGHPVVWIAHYGPTDRGHAS